MKTSFEELESPYLDGELEFVVPTNELSKHLAHVMGESPFVNLTPAGAPLDEPSTGEVFETLFEQEVIDADERTLVANALAVPNRWVCAIDLLIADPKLGKGVPLMMRNSRGTGILIGPRHVLTAKHVLAPVTVRVDNQDVEAPIASVRVSPARHGDNTSHPLGKASSNAIYRSNPYLIKQRKKLPDGRVIDLPITWNDDLALIILDQDLSGRTHTKMKGPLGYWGQTPSQAAVRRLDPANVQGREVTVIGYPGDRCGKDVITGSSADKERLINRCVRNRRDEWASTQWRSQGKVNVDPTTSRIEHTADTYKGESGGPICLRNGDVLDLLGVHANQNPPGIGQPVTSNLGVRVTRHMLREICSWMNTDAGYQIATIKADTLIVQPQTKKARETLEIDTAEILKDLEDTEGLETDESDSCAETEERFRVSDELSDECGKEAEESYEFEDERHEEDFGGEADADLPVDEITEFDVEDAKESGVEDGPLFEAFAPEVSQADLRTRINDYLDLAKFEYTIPKRKLPDGTEVPESKVKVWPQFHFARILPGETRSQRDQRITSATINVRGILGSKFEKDHPNAIHNAAWGRPKPSEVAVITQGLINAGELNAVRQNNPSLTDEQLVRKLQREFAIGIDCAGYVQLAFIFAFLGNDNDTKKVRQSLKLKTRGEEVLNDLPPSHFKVVDFKDAQTGDLFVLKPRDDDDGALHTVVIFEHTVLGDVHTFLVDASWGTDLYGLEAGGVARRELKFNTKTKKWWDISPVDGNFVCGVVDVKKGDKACENDVGPYNGHPIQGMYRTKHN